MANVTILNGTQQDIESGNRVSVRTSGDRVYVFSTKVITVNVGISMEKGNADGEPTSFTEADEISPITGLKIIGGACAIDSNDIIHCIYYVVDTSHGGIIAIRYIPFDTSTDTFGTPESVVTLDNDFSIHDYLGIAIDANDDPHIIWQDALTDMGSTVHTCWYSNKISGSWATRLSVFGGVGSARWSLPNPAFRWRCSG